MNKFLVLSLFLISSIQLFANSDNSTIPNDTVKNWKIGGSGSINFAQGYLSNWVKGGESSITTLSVVNLHSNYSKDKVKWDSNIDFKYGVLKQGDTGFKKNEDIIDVTTKIGYKAFNNWYYSVMESFKSQVTNGYDYPNDSVIVSQFMAPANMHLVVGMDYKPNDNLSVLVSVMTSKSTFVLDTALIDQTKYGLEENERWKQEYGAYIKTKYKIDLTKNILLENKLDLFTNYLENPDRIDVNWELALAMKVNKYISTNISTHLIYDDNIDIPVYVVDATGNKVQNGKTKAIQFKELLSVGFSYKF